MTENGSRDVCNWFTPGCREPHRKSARHNVPGNATEDYPDFKDFYWIPSAAHRALRHAID
jgi:hypothetical protein